MCRALSRQSHPHQVTMIGRLLIIYNLIITTNGGKTVKKNKATKFLALLMCLMMVISILPCQAFAEAVQTTTTKSGSGLPLFRPEPLLVVAV